MRNLLLVLSFFALMAIMFVGLPFEMRTGTVNLVGNRYHFITTSRSIASLVGRATGARLECRGKDVCVTSSDRRHFTPNIPMVFEVCESQSGVDLNDCNGSTLVLKLDTARWLKAGVFK